MKANNAQHAQPTYSTIRTNVLKLTPGDLKCKLYCSGKTCKYCCKGGMPKEKQALRGLYSTWVDEDILAMSRPFPYHFKDYQLIQQFKDANIRAVVNLEEIGEHPFCGSGNCESGFSYDPEVFMREEIFYYNYHLPDFNTCVADHLLNILKVIQFSLQQGKIAIHCHAGHGRTGMLIAAHFIYKYGISPLEAVAKVRAKRANSVQSEEQVSSLNGLFDMLASEALVLSQPDGGHRRMRFRSVEGAIEYERKFLAGEERRRFVYFPKVAYVICIELLERFYESAAFSFRSEREHFYQFGFSLHGQLKRSGVDDVDFLRMIGILTLDDTQETCEYYRWIKEKTILLTIANIDYHIKSMSVSVLLSLLDQYLRSFDQITDDSEMCIFLEENLKQRGRRVVIEKAWHWLFHLTAQTLVALQLHAHHQFARVVALWFTRADSEPIRLRIDRYLVRISEEK